MGLWEDWDKVYMKAYFSPSILEIFVPTYYPIFKDSASAPDSLGRALVVAA